MRFSQRKCSSREVLQPLDCYGGNPCPTAIPYQADSLGGRISADEQVTVLYDVFIGRLVCYSLLGYLAVMFGKNAAQILKEHCAAIFLVLAGFIALLAFIGRLTLRLKGGKSEEPTELSGFSRSQLDPIRAGNAGALFPKVSARLRHGRGEMI